jgi:hypothetical protein
MKPASQIVDNGYFLIERMERLEPEKTLRNPQIANFHSIKALSEQECSKLLICMDLYSSRYATIRRHTAEGKLHRPSVVARIDGGPFSMTALLLRMLIIPGIMEAA